MSKKRQLFDPVDQSIENDPVSQAHLKQQKAVIEITEQALLGSNLSKLSKETIELAKDILHIDFGEILQLDPNHRKLHVVACTDWSSISKSSTNRKYNPGSLMDFVLQHLSPVYSADLRVEQRFEVPDYLKEQNISTMISAAIQGKDNPFGIISVYTRQPRVFSSIEINFIHKIANLLALAVDRRRLESSLLTSRDEIAVILEGIAEGITIQSGDGAIIYANDSAAKLLGFSDRTELQAKTNEELLSRIKVFNENGKIIPLDQYPGQRILKGETEVSEVSRIQDQLTGKERWIITTSSTVFDSMKQERMAINIFQDITDIKENETDQNFLSELSNNLARAVTFDEVLNNIANMAVRYLADWCVVHIVEENGEIRQLAAAHKDPEKVSMILDLEEKYLPAKEDKSGIFQVMKSGQGEFYPLISEEIIKAKAQNDEHYHILKSLGLHSAIILPLNARGHTLGTITFVWERVNQSYTEREKQIGVELAQRAALAIDNVRLYQDARNLNDQLENKVLRRTAQLEQINTKLQTEINDRIQAENELKRSKALFSDLFELSPDAIFLINPAGIIVRVNSQGAFIFGFEQNELVDKNIDLLLPEKFRENHISEFMTNQNLPKINSLGGSFELHGRQKSGKEFPVDVVLSPVKIGEERLVICVVRDISGQKRTQAELAEVQHRLLDSQEAERLKLAQEIHDGTIQELFSINFQLAEINNDAISAGLPELEKKILTASEMTKNVIHGLRNISRNLRPPALAPFGLEQAIISHLEQFQELHPDLIVHTDLEPDGRLLGDNLRLVLFRIYQNSVSNVARHSQAHQLWVRLKFDEQLINLEIEDDGKGFSIPERWVEFVRNGHLGLVGIRERVEAINGRLTIVSSPGNGTLVAVKVPLKK